LFFGGFVGLISLFDLVKGYILKRNKKYDFGEVDIFLKENEENFKLMEKYCKREFSLENINLWKDLNSILQKKEIHFTLFENLMKKYILPLSPFEVNIPG
jgi:hypothetical protein